MQEELFKNLLKIVEKILKLEGNNLESIILFGSRARGDYLSDSDFDILIILRECKDRVIDRPLKYYEVISNMPIDLFVYTVDEFEKMYKDGNCLVFDILYEGVVLYDRGFFTKMRERFMKMLRDGKIERLENGWRIIELED
ncbi:MAG: nucleotidyltransferase domain-containing protein [Crenarchaeota archaeon]|nr:nucleotidyltransferase domain-containing protein [Thermoproteota archaeon]